MPLHHEYLRKGINNITTAGKEKQDSPWSYLVLAQNTDALQIEPAVRITVQCIIHCH